MSAFFATAYAMLSGAVPFVVVIILALLVTQKWWK